MLHSDHHSLTTAMCCTWAILEEHLAASTDPEYSRMSSDGYALVCPYNTFAPRTALVVSLLLGMIQVLAVTYKTVHVIRPGYLGNWLIRTVSNHFV